MMYIEHFVLLAGAYNLGFFYFLFFKLLCVYKDAKHTRQTRNKNFLFYKCKEEKQCDLPPRPKYAILDTPHQRF